MSAADRDELKKLRREKPRRARAALATFHEGRLDIGPRQRAELKDLEDRVTTAAVEAALAAQAYGLAHKGLEVTESQHEES